MRSGWPIMAKKRRKIAWAKAKDGQECGHRWDAKPGETWETSTGTKQAWGSHVCIKAVGHESDPTNDDHQCCCGNSSWVTL